MSAVATAVVVGSAVGGYISSQGAKDAAGIQADAANNASALQYQMYQQQREDAKPWRDVGVSAVNQLNDNMGYYNQPFTMSDFQKDPGYQFRMDEGQKAIERSAAARGGLNSGATLKSLTKYGQNVASDEYSNAYNRFTNSRATQFNQMASLAGIGQTANSQVAAAGSSAAGNIGNNMMSAANAQSAATMAGSNAINNTIGTGMNTWMNYTMMNRMFPQK